MTGWGRLDDRGEVVELVGSMVDLTAVVRSDTQDDVGAAIAGVTAHRAAIEQAKEMLMLALGLPPDAAFDVPRTVIRDSLS